MPEYRSKVDYSLRPAKAAARRMVADVLTRIELPEPVHRCRYVGMGSFFFMDFLLFHRVLGITDMIRIEHKKAAETRTRFNLPLSCIELMMGSTSEVLPRIGLGDKQHVVWLDYESHVGPGVLRDIEEVAARCRPGSILIVTVNADRILNEDDREQWLSDLGADRPEPREPTAREEYARLSYRVLRERIATALGDRNAGEHGERRIEFRQALHLVHADGPRMLTFGGGLFDGRDPQQWERGGVDSLEFVRTGENPYRIDIPALTRREALHLLKAVPETDGGVEEAATQAGIPPKDARQFAAVYRYAPRFVEAEDW